MAKEPLRLNCTPDREILTAGEVRNVCILKCALLRSFASFFRALNDHTRSGSPLQPPEYPSWIPLFNFAHDMAKILSPSNASAGQTRSANVRLVANSDTLVSECVFVETICRSNPRMKDDLRWSAAMLDWFSSVLDLLLDNVQRVGMKRSFSALISITT